MIINLKKKKLGQNFCDKKNLHMNWIASGICEDRMKVQKQIFETHFFNH